jgi:hypothetical protein
MWIRSHSKTYPGLKREDIWRLWVDVNTWDRWDPDIEYGKITEPFAVGSHFIFKPKGMGEVKLTLVEVEPLQKYTDHFRFWGASLFGTHEMEETAEGLKLTTTVKVTGPLTFLWVKLVAQNIADTLPEQMEGLVKCAREDAGQNETPTTQRISHE